MPSYPRKSRRIRCCRSRQVTSLLCLIPHLPPRAIVPAPEQLPEQQGRSGPDLHKPQNPHNPRVSQHGSIGARLCYIGADSALRAEGR